MAKPTANYTWASDGAWNDPGNPWDLLANKVEPAAIRNQGHLPRPLAANHLNWQFNAIGLWLAWAEDRCENVNSAEFFTVKNGGKIQVNSSGQILVDYNGEIRCNGNSLNQRYPIACYDGSGIKIDGHTDAHGSLLLTDYTDALWSSNSTATFATGCTLSIQSGAVQYIRYGGSITVEGNSTNQVFSVTFANGAGAQWQGISGCHTLVDYFGYTDVTWENHATATWASGSTFQIAAGCTATLEAPLTATGAGHYRERFVQVTDDDTVTLSNLQGDHYYVNNSSLTGARQWNLPESGDEAALGRTLICTSDETTHVVTIHGALEDWTIKKGAGLTHSRTFKRVYNGTVNLWVNTASQGT